MSKVIIKATGEIKDLTWHENLGDGGAWVDPLSGDDLDLIFGSLSYTKDEVIPIKSIHVNGLAENVDGSIVIDTTMDWPKDWGDKKKVFVDIYWEEN